MTTRAITAEDIEEFERRRRRAGAQPGVAAEDIPPSSAATPITEQDVEEFEARQAAPGTTFLGPQATEAPADFPQRFTTPEIGTRPSESLRVQAKGRQRLRELLELAKGERPATSVLGAAGQLFNLAGGGAEIGAASVFRRPEQTSFPYALGRQLEAPPLERFLTEAAADPLNLLPGVGFTRLPSRAGAAAREFVPITRPLRTAEAAAGELPPLIGNTEEEIHAAATEVRRKIQQLRGRRYAQPAEVASLERQINLAEANEIARLRARQAASSDVEAAPQVGAIQAGMGIGERPAQGTLGLGGRVGATEPVPLIDAAQVSERQRLAAERAGGQAALTEAVPILKEVSGTVRQVSPGITTPQTEAQRQAIKAFDRARGIKPETLAAQRQARIEAAKTEFLAAHPEIAERLAAERAAGQAALPEASAQATPPPAPTEASTLAAKWSSAKARNSARATKDLQALKAKGYETVDAEDALQEYKDTVRGDFEDAEGFAGARSEAWDSFVDALDTLGPPEIAPIPSTRVLQAAETPSGVPSGALATVRTALPEPPAAAIPPAGPPPARPPVPPVTPPTGALPDPRMPPGEDPVIQKALRVIKGVKRVSKREQAALFATERRTRFARGMEASEGLPIEQGFKPFFAAQAGEFPRPDIEPIVGQFTEGEVSHLFHRIEAPGVLRPGYDRANAASALADLLSPSTAKIPMPRDLALLERAFGSDLVRSLYNKKRSVSQAVWDEFIAGFTLPRSLVASLDLSATLRQGAMLAPGNAQIWKSAVAAELKAYRSETYAAKAWDDIYLHPNFERLTNAGLSLTERGAMAPLLAREEAFISRWASRLPGIRASGRAYVTMLNKLRFDAANKMLADLQAKGLTEADLAKQLEGAVGYINWATGRGAAIGGQGVQAVLNGLMFSPRFTTSRFQVLGLPLTAYQNPAIRTKLAKDLVAWVGLTAMVVGLAKGAGAAVELDPRSGQWGVIHIRRTRYDPWAGMRPVGRLIAQLMWGQGKSSLGKVYSTDDEELISKRQRLKSEGKMTDEEFAKSGRFLPARASVLIRFLRSKLQPLAGETWDQATGKDWLGGEANPGQLLSKDLRVNLFAQNLAPILAQDIIDAVYAQEHPVAIGAAAAASAVGIGASTYWTAADVAREENPGITEQRIKEATKKTQERWQKEADRRRGETVKPKGKGPPLETVPIPVVPGSR